MGVKDNRAFDGARRLWVWGAAMEQVHLAIVIPTQEALLALTQDQCSFEPQERPDDQVSIPLRVTHDAPKRKRKGGRGTRSEPHHVIHCMLLQRCEAYLVYTSSDKSASAFECVTCHCTRHHTRHLWLDRFIYASKYVNISSCKPTWSSVSRAALSPAGTHKVLRGHTILEKKLTMGVAILIPNPVGFRGQLL